MAVSFDHGFQGASLGGGGGTSLSMYPGAVALGDVILLAAGYAAGVGTITGFSDSKSNAYTTVVSRGYSGGVLALAVAPVTSALAGTYVNSVNGGGTGDTQTISSSTASQLFVTGGCFRGLSAVTYAEADTSGNATSIGSVTTSATVTTGDLVFAAVDTGNTGTISTPSGWTPAGLQPTNLGSLATFYRLAPGGGAVTFAPGVSGGGGLRIMEIVAVKAAISATALTMLV